MKKEKLFPKAGLLLVYLYLSLYLSCSGYRKEIDKQVSILYSSQIDIPASEMDTLVYDSAYMHKKPNYQILVYVDSLQCTSCYASHIFEWEEILRACRDYYMQSISMTFIIEGNISEEEKELFLASSFNKTIFLDKKGIFRKTNISFPKSEILHVLLLDEKGSVLLVGNPLYNKKIEDMLYSRMRDSMKK